MKSQSGLPSRPECWRNLFRGRGFDPWSGKIPHAMGQLTLCATTTEPMFCNKSSSRRTATKEWPLPASTRESPCTATETQRRGKNANEKRSF